MSDGSGIKEGASGNRIDFNRDVARLASGTAFAQVLMALASPVLARLFAPEIFGTFTLFTSITGIIASILCLRYDLAIVLPKRNSDAANLLAGSLGIAGLIALLTIPFIRFGGGSFARWLNAPEIAPYLWWIPVALFFGGIGAGHPALNAWASREKRFTLISYTRILGALVTILVQLTLGLSGLRSGGSLILGGLAGSILSPLLLGLSIWRQDRSRFFQSVNWTSLRANLWEYRKFPLYNTFAALLNTISWQIPTFLLSFFFSTSVVGYYALGSQLLRAPMDLIGGSIGQVFYSHAADARHDGTLAAFVEATFRRLVEYSLFPMLVLTVTGRELFAVLFGPQWAEAGVYTQMLSVWMCFWFISSPMSRLYAVLNRNEMGLALNVVILLSRVASIWLGGMLDSPRAAIGFFSISGVLVYGYLSVSIMVLAGVSWRNTGWILLRNVALFVPAGGVLVVLGTAGVSAWMQVLVAGVFLLCYFMYRLGVRSTVESVKVFLRNVLNSPAHGK